MRRQAEIQPVGVGALQYGRAHRRVIIARSRQSVIRNVLKMRLGLANGSHAAVLTAQHKAVSLQPELRVF
jgi:hypothetical protein